MYRGEVAAEEGGLQKASVARGLSGQVGSGGRLMNPPFFSESGMGIFFRLVVDIYSTNNTEKSACNPVISPTPPLLTATKKKV